MAIRATVWRFAEAEHPNIIAEVVEAETGKGADALDRRPQLAAGCNRGRQMQRHRLQAGLSRDVAFVSALMAQR